MKPVAPNMVLKKLFNKWKSSMIQKVDSRIYHLSRNLNRKESSCVLRKTTVKQHLKDLDSKYVIAPIDNVTSNAAFICQRFYALLLV